MIAIDTNVLVRFLVQDDPVQTAACIRFVETLSADNPGYVSREVLVEFVWVLERAYRYKRPMIAITVQRLLEAAELVVEAADDVGALLDLYRDEGCGFADLMIAAAAQRAGAEKLVTLDRKAAELSGAELLAS